jgi:hypothetical protein
MLKHLQLMLTQPNTFSKGCGKSSTNLSHEEANLNKPAAQCTTIGSTQKNMQQVSEDTSLKRPKKGRCVKFTTPSVSCFLPV